MYDNENSVGEYTTDIFVRLESSVYDIAGSLSRKKRMRAAFVAMKLVIRTLSTYAMKVIVIKVMELIKLKHLSLKVSNFRNIL